MVRNYRIKMLIGEILLYFQRNRINNINEGVGTTQNNCAFVSITDSATGSFCGHSFAAGIVEEEKDSLNEE